MLPDARPQESARAKVHGYTAGDDGLALPWFGTVFLNPPYGRALPEWISKARREVQAGNARIAGTASVFFLKGRLKFGNSGQAAPFPSALALWRADDGQLARLEAVLEACRVL